MAANVFKVARVLSGKKQCEVAREARIPFSALSMIENGWLIPKPAQLKRLKKVLPRLEEAEGLTR